MPVTRITRHDSTLSDKSDASACSTDSHNSAKKVSFNKAVRIKKYKNKGKEISPSEIMNGEPSSEKRFWFKVYKNRYNEEPIIGSDVSVADSFTQTPPRGSPYLRNDIPPLHESQFPTDPPPIPRHLVKKIVSKFNEEAALRDLAEEDEDGLPYYYYRYYMEESPEHPNYYVRSISPKPKEKKNPLVSGVKVIFGKPRRKKKEKFVKTDDNNIVYYRGPYTTKIVVPDDKEYPRGRREKRITYIDVYPEERREKTKRSLSPPASRARSYTNEPVSRVSSDDDLLHRSSPKAPARRGRREKKITYIDVYPEERRPKRSLSPPASRAREYTNESLTRVSSDDDLIRRSSPPVSVEEWCSGDQLILDSTDFHKSSEKTDEGEFLKAVGEKHQVWQNKTRTIIYEEPSPKPVNRRKVKSQNDLTEKNHVRKIYVDDKGISTNDLNYSNDDGNKWLNYGSNNSPKWLKWRSLQHDKETQCGKIPSHYHTSHMNEHQDSIKERVIRSSNGYVSAFSNVPSLPSSRSPSPSPSRSDRSRSPCPEGVIYSQVDKSKKKKNKKFTSEAEVQSDPHYDHLNAYPAPSNVSSGKSDREVKTSKRLFGFKLKTPSKKNVEEEKNWYDVDADVESVEKNRRSGKTAITEIREADCASDISVEAADLYRNEQTTPGSVIREVDFKKGEISYENVPRQENIPPGGVVTSGGLWFRDADEDYRREMAQSEVAFPPGSQVGSDKYSSLGRLERVRRTPSPTPRSRTLDRLLLNDIRRRERSPPGVKVLLNGKEMDVRDTGSLRKKNQKKVRHVVEDKNPSSVQSDPTCVRGGLAAAYQARQRAALKRSKSSAGNITRSRNHLSPRRRAVTSSAASSSDSESAHRRRTLVMYIPGISHQRRRAEDEDERLSGANISRSQSMLSSRPPKYVRNGVIRQNKQKDEMEEIVPLASDSTRKPRSGSENRKNDIARRHSIPKNTKFSWLKWRLKGKPSREP